MTSTIIVKADSKLKEEAQKTAADLGLTLTAVVNSYLQDFVQKKSVFFTVSKTDFFDPYGSMSGKPIAEKEIKQASLNWQKAIQKIG